LNGKSSDTETMPQTFSFCFYIENYSLTVISDYRHLFMYLQL